MNTKSLSLVSMLCISIVAITSCKKDKGSSTSSSPTPTVTATMSCMVDNNSWSALSSKVGASIINNISNVTGVASDSSAITMTIQESIVLNGSYDLGPASSNAAAYSLDGTTPAWTSNANPSSYGTLTVTAMDTVNTRISGTFEFYAWRATDNSFRSITGGVFTDVYYSTSISGTGNNTFTVDINGTAFTPAAINGIVNAGQLSIIATDNQGVKTVSVVMPQSTVAGTYNLGQPFTSNYFGQYNHDATTFTGSTSGTLTVTTHNTSTNLVEGTFSFVSEPLGGGSPTFNLTNGTFSVTY